MDGRRWRRMLQRNGEEKEEGIRRMVMGKIRQEKRE
jgi:hypothetical protein